MKHKIILNSFKESFIAIKKNKMFFLVLFLLQLIFFSLIFIVNLNYQPKILESVNNVLDYLSKMNPVEDKILGEDPLMIHRNYENVVYNLKLLLIWCLLIFILVNGSVWYLTNRLIYNQNIKKIKKYKKIKKEFFIYLSKFAITSLIFFLLIVFFSYSNFKISILNLIYGTSNPGSFVSLFLVLVLFYFMYLAFSLIYKVEFKNIFKELFNIGVKKAHIILLTYFINLIVILIFFLLIVFLIEKNIILLSLIILLWMLSFVWAKVFLVNVVKKLV